MDKLTLRTKLAGRDGEDDCLTQLLQQNFDVFVKAALEAMAQYTNEEYVISFTLTPAAILESPLHDR